MFERCEHTADTVPDGKESHNDGYTTISMVFHRLRHMNVVLTTDDLRGSIPSCRSTDNLLVSEKCQAKWGEVIWAKFEFYSKIMNYLGWCVVKSAFWTTPLNNFLFFWNIFTLVRIISAIFCAILMHSLLCNTIGSPSPHAIQVQEAEAIFTWPNLEATQVFSIIMTKSSQMNAFYLHNQFVSQLQYKLNM